MYSVQTTHGSFIIFCPDPPLGVLFAYEPKYVKTPSTSVHHEEVYKNITILSHAHPQTSLQSSFSAPPAFIFCYFLNEVWHSLLQNFN